MVYPHIPDIPFYDVAGSSFLTTRLVLTRHVYCESYFIAIDDG